MLGEVRVWDVPSRDNKPVSQWTSVDFTSWGTIKTHHYCGGIYGLAFAPDGRALVYTVGDDTVHLADPATGDPLRTFTAGSSTTVDGVAFSPDGTHLATIGGIEGTLRTWPR